MSEENTLTVNVTRLRKKLEAIGLDRFHCDPDRQRVYRGMSAPVAASCR